MAWYEFGTATVANGATAVTLSAGATAIANVKAGDSLIFKGTQFPPVEIGSDPTVNTTITLRNAWPYAAQTAVAYTIQPGPGWSSVAALGQDVSQYLAAVSGVFGSDTSNTIGTGSKTWNIQPNARLAVGARVRFSDIAAPSTNWAEGVVTAYAGRALTVLVDLVGGSGTIALWNWNHAGGRGAQGIQGIQGPMATAPWVFPATQVPVVDPNTLDDYEEGTWTPGLTFGGGNVGMTFSAQAGSYVKIGKLVFVRWNFTLSAKGASTGAAFITGLPFVAGQYSTGVTDFYANMASMANPTFEIYQSTTTAALYIGGASASSLGSHANFTDTSRMFCGAVYIANA